MWRGLLRSASFRRRLFDLDVHLATEARSRGCPKCGHALHAANYPRKPRGGPETAPTDADFRHSFCCSGRDCRRRATPPSVRFLDRRVYLSVVVILAVVASAGVTGPRLRVLRDELGIDRRTLERWRGWWRDEVPRTDWWWRVRGALASPVLETNLPGGLLMRMEGSDHEDRLLAFLRLLRPLSQSPAMRSRFSMGS